MRDEDLPGASEPSPDAVLAALDRVLASTAFRRASRSRDFLSYVVTETLAGRGDRLSERTVGRRALGRDDAATSSASVRVRAGRVRAALDGYYADEGVDDPVRISVPPWAYVAQFEARPTSAQHSPGVPGVAVLAFASTGGEPSAALAASLSDSLVHRLAPFPHLRVVGPTGLLGDVRRTGAELGVTSVLVGKVARRGESVRVSVRLHASDTGEVTWSAELTLSRSDLAGFEAEDAWAQQIAALLGDTTGLVVRQELARPQARPDEGEVAARLAFYSYVDAGTVDSLVEATAILDRAMASGTRTAPVLAMRAALANAAQIYGVLPRQEGLEQAAALAREALARDGGNAHAHLVLGSVAQYRGLWDLAERHAEEAVTLAPLHPSYLVGAGITLCGSARWDRGAALINEAHRLHPGLAGHTRTWLAAGHLVHADHARALGEASRLPSGGGFVWGPLYRAMALAGLGHLEQARAEAEQAARMRPEVIVDPGAYFGGRMRLTAEQRDHLVALVRAAATASEPSGPVG